MYVYTTCVFVTILQSPEDPKWLISVKSAVYLIVGVSVVSFYCVHCIYSPTNLHCLFLSVYVLAGCFLVCLLLALKNTCTVCYLVTCGVSLVVYSMLMLTHCLNCLSSFSFTLLTGTHLQAKQFTYVLVHTVICTCTCTVQGKLSFSSKLADCINSCSCMLYFSGDYIL